jgi:hypothetical protein
VKDIEIGYDRELVKKGEAAVNKAVARVLSDGDFVEQGSLADKLLDAAIELENEIHEEEDALSRNDAGRGYNGITSREWLVLDRVFVGMLHRRGICDLDPAAFAKAAKKLGKKAVTELQSVIDVYTDTSEIAAAKLEALTPKQRAVVGRLVNEDGLPFDQAVAQVGGARVSYPTPEMLREMANEEGQPADVQALLLTAADALEQRGFYATAHMFLITEDKALEVETRGIISAGTHPEVPGWRCFYEGKVRMNDDGTDLDTITAFEATENQYGTHEAAVLDAMHAMRQAGVTVRRTTKKQKKQPVYILPSYIGVATDKAGEVIR